MIRWHEMTDAQKRKATIDIILCVIAGALIIATLALL